MHQLSNLVRPEGDPKVLSTGPSSLDASDRLARNLGWFSIGLGLAEIFAARRLSHALGVPAAENLIRAFGAREIGSGMLSLSMEKQTGMLSRVAGDALDIAALGAAMRPDNPKRGNVALALTMVLGVTLLDVIAAQSTTSRNARKSGDHRDFSDRSGFPKGIRAARVSSPGAYNEP